MEHSMKRVGAILIALLICECALAEAGTDAAELYHAYCSVCHGDKGDGNSYARAGLIPAPTDFTTPEAAIYLTRDRMIESVSRGRGGTAMTPWKSRLDDSEIEAIVDFIRTRFMLAADTDDAGYGREIYAEYCSVCHGDAGRGSVWANAGLSPPPVDFTDPAVKAKLDRERMIRSVMYGRPETAMTGWAGRLSPADVDAVVDYIRDGFMALAEKDTVPNYENVDMNAPFPDELSGDAARGMGWYIANCSTCHGVTGDGRGPRAYFINPKPRNFLHTASRASLNRPALYDAIRKGRLRTEMPAWERVLTPQQMADTAEYVFTRFIQPR